MSDEHTLTFGSLFAGIGGFDLGFERAGMVCKWQVEIDPYCRRVLAKHWPVVRRHDDVRTFPPACQWCLSGRRDCGCSGHRLDWAVDVICGGFPCQDVSDAGEREGIEGESSGLWVDFCRIIGILRPRFAVVENVPGLLARGMDRVLGDLASIGYDAEWSVLSACTLGAPHTRERVFLLVYPSRIAAGSNRRSEPPKTENWWLSEPRIRPCAAGTPWASEPGVARVADGIPARMDRLKALGNAVVPQVSEWIGRRIIESEVEYVAG